MLLKSLPNIAILMFFGVQCATAQETTTENPGMMMTTEDLDKTDIPQALVDEALNHDVGRYTTMSFYYYNNQYVKEREELNTHCMDHYIRCILSQTQPTPVCAYNHNYQHFGWISANSYCDVYFENCRMGHRVWRIIDFGKCMPHAGGEMIPKMTRKMMAKNENVSQLRKFLNWINRKLINNS